MNKRFVVKRMLVALLILAMTVTYTPVTFAESITDQGAHQTKVSEDKNALTEEDSKAFDQKAEIDDVIVRVEAEKGVFPKGAELIVKKASAKEEKQADQAIDEVRSAKRKVVDSHTFDIKVVTAEGEELQPKEDQKVNVSFTMKPAADKNLSADIYHITENEVIDKKTKETEIVTEAEKLEAETDAKEESVTAETDGFSLYTVEFTYGEKKYAMEHKESVELSEILEAVEITGDPTEVVTNDPEVLAASKNESDKWMITLLKAFKGEMDLTVTIDEIDYTIKVKVSDVVFVNSWKQLQDAVKEESNNGKTIMLENDISCNNNESIKVDGDDVDKITIDLDGHTMDRKRSSRDGDGHVIDVKDEATLTIMSSADDGKLTGGYATDGGGIMIEKKSKCIINSNGGNSVIIQGNRSQKDGGGICVCGTLEMKGGTITGNKAGDEGGGIYVEGTGRLDIDGVTISENSSEDDGGGLRVDLRKNDEYSQGSITNCIITGNKSTESDGGGLSLEAKREDTPKVLEVEDTVFTGNTASDEGGGINVDAGQILMTGGSVSGNTAADGGGFMNDGMTLFLYSVEVSGNKSTKYNGGGITNKNSDETGLVRLENSRFTGNTSKNYGGAIYSKGDLEILGGVIGGDENSYNMAYEGGGGIWVADGTIKVRGASIITDNRSSDIYLCKDMKIKVHGALKDGGNKAKIGVVLSKSTGIFTKGFLENNPEEDPYDYFIPEPGHSVVLDGNEARVNASNWGTLQHRINKARSNEVIKLDADYKATADDSSLKIPADKVITIDLNGHTLDRNCSKVLDDGSVIELLSNDVVSSKLTIEDSAGGGKITGGWAKNGGGIYVNTNCSLTLQGGNITGNKAEKVNGEGGGGGGIYCDMEPEASSEHTLVSIENGTISDNEAVIGGAICSLGTTEIRHIGANEHIVISDNKAGEDGGAIYIASGTTTIKNGSISKNTAAEKGGAVYINEDATLELYGGNLTSNSAYEGGGIWHGEGVLKAQGTPAVAQNRATIGNNIMLENGKMIQVTGELKISGTGASAMLDVMTDDINKPLTKDLDKCVPEGSSAEKIEERAGFVFTYSGAKYKDSMEIREDDGELYHQAVHTDLLVSSWAELQAAVSNSDNEGKTIGLACDIDAGNDDYSIKVTMTTASRWMEMIWVKAKASPSSFAATGWTENATRIRATDTRSMSRIKRT